MLRTFHRFPYKFQKFVSSRNLQGLIVGVPKESLEGEYRVALVPENIVKLKKAGATVLIEKGAGLASGFTDAQVIL
jgi:hypothetical protein